MQPYYYLRGETKLPETPDLDHHVRRFTDEATKFIRKAAAGDKPFFLNSPTTIRTRRSRRRRNSRARRNAAHSATRCRSLTGAWGKCSIRARVKVGQTHAGDFHVGNGPWLRGEQGEWPGRCGAGRTTYEGGMREPCVMWWPGKIPAGTSAAKWRPRSISCRRCRARRHEAAGRPHDRRPRIHPAHG